MRKKEGRLNVRIDGTLLCKVRALAHQDGRTLTELVESSFRQFLHEKEDEQLRRNPPEAEQI